MKDPIQRNGLDYQRLLHIERNPGLQIWIDGVGSRVPTDLVAPPPVRQNLVYESWKFDWFDAWRGDGIFLPAVPLRDPAF
jgi:hypothetical protein